MSKVRNLGHQPSSIHGPFVKCLSVANTHLAVMRQIKHEVKKRGVNPRSLGSDVPVYTPEAKESKVCAVCQTNRTRTHMGANRWADFR